jgi:hypothetical protein
MGDHFVIRIPSKNDRGWALSKEVENGTMKPAGSVVARELTDRRAMNSAAKLALLLAVSSPCAMAGETTCRILGLCDGVLRQDKDGRFDALLPPPFVSNHASMVETNGQGSYKMAWFSGTFEGQDDVSIVVSHLTLNMTGGFEGAVWNAAPVVSQRDGYSNQNAGRSCRLVLQL